MHNTPYVLHTVPSLNPEHGGPSRTTVALTEAISRLGHYGVVLLSQGPLGGSVVTSSNTLTFQHVHETKSKIALALGIAAKRGLSLVGRAHPPSFIHSHGVWHPVNYWSAEVARRFDVPLIIQPRGMLEPWALANKAWKKRLALALYQRRDLQCAKLLIASAEMEYEAFRRLGLTQPVAVIPNGVVMPKVDPRHDSNRSSVGESKRATKQSTDANVAAKSRVKRALFLSRIHPKKGVVELIRAWAEVKPANWHLTIAGPDENGHLAEVQRELVRLSLSDVVSYVGSVDGEDKDLLYSQSDLFVLPTFSENFGLVVAEALSFGTPVITTRGAPWADLEIFGCGWWVDTGVMPLANALRQATTLNDVDRHAMGERGRCYVQRYNWDSIAEDTVGLYRWLLGESDRPACVRLD